MRNARSQPKWPANRAPRRRSVAGQRQLTSTMKTTLLLTSLVAGVALMGCNKTNTRTATADSTTPTTDTAAARTASTTPSATTPATTDTVGAKIDRAADNVRDASRDAAASLRTAGRDLSARMTEWRLSKSEIEADVMANRPIVRTRTDAITPTGRFDEDTMEKAIKGRLQADSMLANLKFDVNANKQGEVELEGKAATTDQIAHAIALALDNDGVTKVTSKVKLDPDAGRR